MFFVFTGLTNKKHTFVSTLSLMEQAFVYLSIMYKSYMYEKTLRILTHS